MIRTLCRLAVPRVLVLLKGKPQSTTLLSKREKTDRGNTTKWIHFAT